jgi:hypothetical protein
MKNSPEGLATNGVVLVSDAAAGARAHGVHAPAEANRGDQLVVGTHGVVRMKTQKKTKPRRDEPAGVFQYRKARNAFRMRSKAMSDGDERLDGLSEFHGGRDCGDLG